MNKIDNLQVIKKLDPDNVLGSIEVLGEQINQVWQEFKKIKVPESYSKIDQIVVNGMGGSQLGAHIIQSLFFDQLKLPLSIINSYKIPASLNRRTLYIISSYSGSTEEPISTINAAKVRGAKIFAIASGGKLGRLVKQGYLPGYVFEPTFNPSGQPRMGLGYSLAAQLALLNRLKLIKISDSAMNQALNVINRFQIKFGFSNPATKNPAKKIAGQITGKSVAIVASEFLAGNAQVFANQTNETGKTYASYFLIPELNHHLLEGLKYPHFNRQSLLFIFLLSKLYYPKNQLRYRITQSVVAKNKVRYESYQFLAMTKFEQVLEALLLSSYVTFYLAIINNINPNVIPWVDYFKDQLKKAK